MIVALSPWVESLRDSSSAVAAVAGALVAIAAAAKLPLISRPIRWAWSHLVAPPLAAWMDGVLHGHTQPIHDRIMTVEHEVRTNDGSSLRDVADRIELVARDTATQNGVMATQIDEMRTQIEAVAEQIRQKPPADPPREADNDEV